MAKFRLLWSLGVVLGVAALSYGHAYAATTNAGFDIECAVEGFSQAGTVLGKNSTLPGKCAFKGDYSLFFWDPDQGVDMTGVGYVSTDCSGAVLPGGILNCNFGKGVQYESFIEGGNVFLERDGEGTMLIETSSSDGICGTHKNALELDVSVVRSGRSVLFNSDGEEKAGSGLIPQVGYNYTITGRADKCYAGQISGCYDLRFFVPNDDYVGDCTVCVDGAGHVTGGQCSCHSDHTEYLSEIVTGGYTLGESCQSSTGYLWFDTSSDLICGDASAMAIDFAVALGGTEILGSCDPGQFILGSSSGASPTATPSASPGASTSPTATPSPTPTSTSSVSASASTTPSPTPTSSTAATTSATATATPTATATASSAATASATPAATATASSAATASATSAVTTTATPSVTATATVTPTATVTSTASVTPTDTATPTETPTPLPTTSPVP